MSEYRFSLTCIFHYKGRIFDSQVAAKPSLYVYIYEVLSIAPISFCIVKWRIEHLFPNPKNSNITRPGFQINSGLPCKTNVAINKL